MKRFKNILFVADAELNTSDAYKRAVTLAEFNHAQLTIVSVLNDLPIDSGEEIQGVSMAGLREALIDKQQLQLDAMVLSAKKKIAVSSKVLTGIDFLTLIHEVLINKIDLLIKTVDEEGMMDKLFTSSDMHLLRKCPCPVWLIKSSANKHYKKIMAAVDFNPFDNNAQIDSLNRQILQMSTALAQSDVSELHIIHVWYAYGESRMRSGLAYQPKAFVDAYVEQTHARHKEILDKLVADIDKRKTTIHLVKGLAKDMIPKMVNEQQIDLVIMGTVGRTGIPGFVIGNTSETILNRIDCSVLAVKPEGFISPVSSNE